MDLKSLQELASFSLARYIWQCYINYHNTIICWQVCRPCSLFEWKNICELKTFLSDLYPKLPDVVRRSVLDSVVLVDKELSRWRSNLQYIIHHFEDISWTPFLTIDRVSSQCLSKKFDMNAQTLCECCLSSYVDIYRSTLSSREIKNIHTIFGDYIDHVILYWHWYGRENRSLLSHMYKYSVYYQDCQPIENIFKLSVFIEYEVAVFHYWTKMSECVRTKYHSLVIPLLLCESDNLEFIALRELLPFHTFSFFWQQLNNAERFDVVQYYFLDFYRYMLYHETGIKLIDAVLDVWNPSLGSIEYFKVLRLAADTNNLELFVLLWKRKLARLSFEAIGHLMWTILLQKDIDFKLSVMMISDYNAEHKIEVLNELDKRIDCVKFDFNDRIDKFLATASLEHLRVTGFPRNPRPRRERMRYRARRRTHRRVY